jgi:putative ABC transport system permease protein
MSELKSALRQMAKSPGFATAAVLVLALGIGVNTAIFSVVEAALLRPLPFPQADRLFRVYEALDDQPGRANSLDLSEITLRQWREHGSDIFSGLAAAAPTSLTLGNATGEAPRYVPAARITADFFTVLGLAPAIGRNFTPDEDKPTGPRAVLLSHNLWQRQFGGRPDVLGQTIQLDGTPHTIIGVMPARFRHPYRAEVWVPLAARFEPSPTRYRYLYGVARLQPGVPLAAADMAIRRMCLNVNAAAPDPQNARCAYLSPLRAGFIADLQPKLLAIYGAALCALLIAAANFAGVLLVRGVEREGETAIRAALGATPRQLLRESLALAFVLAALGTLLGLLLATWVTPGLVALSPEGSDATGSVMREFDHAVRLDLPVFACATGAFLLAGFGFGLLPAWRASRADLRSTMSRGTRSSTLGRGTHRTLGLLVIGEIALALVLLVGTGLLACHFRTLIEQPWGFATKNRLSFNVSLDAPYPTAEARVQTLDHILRELRALPGVRSATVTVPHPLYSAQQLLGNNAEGNPAPEPRGVNLSCLRATVPGYFATAGHTLVHGRDFTESDNADSPRVCIVNESYAHRFWPGQDAIGKRVKWGRFDNARRPWFVVVGVAADTRMVADPGNNQTEGAICVPLRQFLAEILAFNEFTFVLETDVAPLSLENAVRTAVARADNRLAAYALTSLDDYAAQTRATERFALVLVSLFGVLGLVLSTIGLYGLLTLQVTRRMRESGIRVALGSTATGVFRLVARQGLSLLGGGLVLGGFAAWAAVNFARSHWPEFPSASLSVFGGASLVLAIAVGLACWRPARRAARADPMLALKSE